MNRAQILDTAKSHVTKDRNTTHGEPEDSFSRIAEYWSVHLKKEITAWDVGMMMGLFKHARAEANPVHMDNYIDADGYYACAGEIAGKEKSIADTIRDVMKTPTKLHKLVVSKTPQSTEKP